MFNKMPSMKARRFRLAPFACMAIGLAACTIRIGPYEGDGSAENAQGSGGTSNTQGPAQNLPSDPQSRQAEVDAYLEQLKIAYNVVAETEKSALAPALWWAAFDGAPPPYEILSYLPWKSVDELLPPPGIELPQTELDGLSELPGPVGTTPILPPDFSAYVMDNEGAVSLQDYLDRHQVFGMPADQDRLYAGLDSTEANRGASAIINHFGGEVEDHTLSLVEVAVSCPKVGPPQEMIGVMLAIDRANPKSRRQAAEEGVKPRIHVEYIRQVNGKEKGVWDMDGPGFEPYRYDWGNLSDYLKLPGRTLLGGKVSLSVPGGTQVEHRIDIFQMPWGDWWIAYRGEFLGYYPAGLFKMLNTGACRASWYAEAYDGTPIQWTTTDMGSGQFAEAGLGKAAYIRRPKFRDMNWLELDPVDNKDHHSKPNFPACYTRSILFLNDPLLGDHFFYGGPGGGSPGCN
jgi:Neprosin